ncbi:hypothetical protein CF70_034845 [Cupriavidus sp. SK-3]|uniref:DUF1840 domain-containing protein n=1 Tax=Cupriavidus sp. SK-3 TaxID=1470558 RepID=UPI000451473B|nr:DUF1840 domain-containing protein [Cupriavidus sp. SK-3]KDP87694.1 hypothetical protein CF70_034845 [Cupriavidus sp. SK-3]
MLVTLHSPAAPDVTMLSDRAQYLVGIVGRRIGERGVIPAAIGKLEAAISADLAARVEDGDPVQGVAMAHRQACGTLSQCAYPFPGMMRVARRQQADILWGV